MFLFFSKFIEFLKILFASYSNLTFSNRFEKYKKFKIQLHRTFQSAVMNELYVNVQLLFASNKNLCSLAAWRYGTIGIST